MIVITESGQKQRSPSGAVGHVAAPDAGPTTWRVQLYRRHESSILKLGHPALLLAGKDRQDVEEIALMGRDPRVWRAVCTPFYGTGG